MLDQNLAILRGLPPELQNDRTILRRAIQQDSLAVLMMPPEFKDDEVLMKMAVRSNPLVYKFISPRLQSNEYIIGLALQESKAEIWNTVPQTFRDDPEFMEPRVLANCRLLEFYETADDELVKKCASRDRQSFVFADESLRGDIKVVRPLLREDPKLFQICFRQFA